MVDSWGMQLEELFGFPCSCPSGGIHVHMVPIRVSMHVDKPFFSKLDEWPMAEVR